MMAVKSTLTLQVCSIRSGCGGKSCVSHRILPGRCTAIGNCSNAYGHATAHNLTLAKLESWSTARRGPASWAGWLSLLLGKGVRLGLSRPGPGTLYLPGPMACRCQSSSRHPSVPNHTCLGVLSTLCHRCGTYLFSSGATLDTSPIRSTSSLLRLRPPAWQSLPAAGLCASSLVMMLSTAVWVSAQTRMGWEPRTPACRWASITLKAWTMVCVCRQNARARHMTG